MDSFTKTVIVYPLIAILVLLSVLYMFHRRRQMEKQGLPVVPGDASMSAATTVGHSFGSQHPMLVAILFAISGIGLLAMNVHFAGAGLALFGVAMIIGRLLIQYIPGYKKESFLSQAVFLLITLVAVCLVCYEILLLQK